MTGPQFPAWFMTQMARLAGLPFAPPTLDTHWLGLSDLPREVLGRAVTRAAKVRERFPSPAELREDADIASPAPAWREIEGEPLPEPVEIGVLPDGTKLPRARSVYTYRCAVCDDTGWKPVGEDGRTVTKCPCWETNPVLIRARDRMRKYAEARAK